MESSVPMWAFSGLMTVFMLVLGLFMNGMRNALDRTTEAVTKLSIDLPREYTSKADMERHRVEDQIAHGDARAEIRSVRGALRDVETRVTVIAGDVNAARGELRG